MLDLSSLITMRSRPAIIVEAARHGAKNYRRSKMLGRLLGKSDLRPGDAIMRLLDMETELDQQRRLGAPSYTIMEHLNVLIAILGEARFLRYSNQEA